MNTASKLGAILVLSVAGISAAQADTVAMWTFESSVPTTAGPHAAEVGSGTALGFHAGATTYSNPVGNGSAESFSSTNWLDGDYYQFSVSTIGFADLSLSWDQTSSNTGPRDFRLDYSIDGGATFTTFANYAVLANGGAPNAAWSGGTASAVYSFTRNLAAIDGLENLALAVFRLVDASGSVSANGGVVGLGGTNRVDNFTVSASPVPVPAAVWLLGSGLLGLAGLRRRRIAMA